MLDRIVSVLSCALVAPALAGAQPPLVKGEQKISNLAGGFPGPGQMTPNADFGEGVAWIGDVDGDGNLDIAVGAPRDETWGDDRGAVYVVLLNADGSAKAYRKITEGFNGFPLGALDEGDRFGLEVTPVGDMNADGVPDLAVGAPYDDDDGGIFEGHDRGAVWLLFLDEGGGVDGVQKISQSAGAFTGDLFENIKFGSAVASLGDLDGDGFGDVAVGAPGYSNPFKGELWILFLDADSRVKAHQRIGAGAGGLAEPLESSDWFGSSVTSLGDLDGDGVTDLAVGVPGHHLGAPGVDEGAVLVLFMNPDGTVKSERLITEGQAGFAGDLDEDDYFGWSLASLGDLDADGVPDLAVGTPYDDDGGSATGAAWILFLNADATVRDHSKISATSGGMEGYLSPGDFFGSGLNAVTDANGATRLLVGASSDDDGSPNTGAAWALTLDESGQVVARRKHSDATNALPSPLGEESRFGHAVAALPDLDADGLGEILVGSPGTSFAAFYEAGVAWLLRPNADATVASHVRIGQFAGGIEGLQLNRFADSVAAIGDVNADGHTDLGVGAPGHIDSPLGHGPTEGAVYVLFLDGAGTVIDQQLIHPGDAGFDADWDEQDEAGHAVAPLGDLNGDGVVDIAVGVIGDDEGWEDAGAVSILFLDDDGTVDSHRKITLAEAGFDGPGSIGAGFGKSLANLGDIDGDGVTDLGVGAWNLGNGSAFVLMLNEDGTVKSSQRLATASGGIDDEFVGAQNVGYALANAGDLDHDGIDDLAVGALFGNEGLESAGMIFLITLEPDGTAGAIRKISAEEGGFHGDVKEYDRLGASLARIDDLDGDGIAELAVGAQGDDDGADEAGAVWVLFMNPFCYADFDDDGQTSILDFVAFQQTFQAADPGADCNDDDELSVLDFVCFQQAFVSGCE